MIRANFICALIQLPLQRVPGDTKGRWGPTREKAASVTQVPSVTPADNTDKMDLSSRDYIFPDSNSRYLTDEDLSGYSSDQLELAKMRFMPDMAGNL